jgi:hypothetical protein
MIPEQCLVFIFLIIIFFPLVKTCGNISASERGDILLLLDTPNRPVGWLIMQNGLFFFILFIF